MHPPTLDLPLYCAIKNATVNFASQVEGKNLLTAQNNDIGAASGTLLTGV